MPKSRVYFAPVTDGEKVPSLAEKTLRLARAAGFDKLIAKGRPCAIKTHFGEGENLGHVKPSVIAEMVQLAKEAGGLPFVTDTNTLYRGRRSDAVSHIQQAADHGFTLESLGAPIIIADGLHGADQVAIPISGGKHFKEVRIATALHQAASSIVITHVKGHCLMGLGGSIKNVGMGCSARAGKLAQHQGGQPEFIEAKCIGCGICVRWCPTDAITLDAHKKKAHLTPERCIGCGECLALCPCDAIGFGWVTQGPEIIEKVCEHTKGFLSNKEGRVGYINFVTDLTKDCDCMGHKQKNEYANIGILASTDIVAIDKAAADLAQKAFNKDIWSAWWPESNYASQFTYGPKVGIGSADYELVTLPK